MSFSKKSQFFKKYHFEIKHLLVILIILLVFQILVSLIHKASLKNLLNKTQDWYEQDSAEKLANLTATSLELLLENTATSRLQTSEEIQRIIQAFNIILSQQILQQNVQEIAILVPVNGKIHAIDNGRVLYKYFFQQKGELPPPERSHIQAIRFYEKIQDQLVRNEQIYSLREEENIFHVFVPFVPKGEYAGVVYVKNKPDFSFITSEVINSYDKIALVFASLIFLGLLAMFYISFYTVKERNEAQQLLFKEREAHIREQIHHQKEALFAKRIYHTHHKAEKVMGFIKEDLRCLNSQNIEEIKYRVNKYANFMSRVIYDMKWYDPPLQTFRSPIFKTNLNEVIQFIVKNIFLRISKPDNEFQFHLDLDETLPPISINEFVVWEILEPLIQNSIDHSGNRQVNIYIKTWYDRRNHKGFIYIADDGKGILPGLLEDTEDGRKKIFLEHVSTKQKGFNSGFGCYLAYEIARQRCGWNLDVTNLNGRGCQFTIEIPKIDG